MKVLDKNEALRFQPTPQVKHKDVYLRVFDTTKKAMYMFPIVSGKGNKYLMVVVELDGKYIDAEPMKARMTSEFIKTYQEIY